MCVFVCGEVGGLGAVFGVMLEDQTNSFSQEQEQSPQHTSYIILVRLSSLFTTVVKCLLKAEDCRRRDLVTANIIYWFDKAGKEEEGRWAGGG